MSKKLEILILAVETVLKEWERGTILAEDATGSHALMDMEDAILAFHLENDLAAEAKNDD